MLDVGSMSMAAAAGAGSNGLKAASRGILEGPRSPPHTLPLATGPHMFPYTKRTPEGVTPEGSPKSTTDLLGLGVPVGAAAAGSAAGRGSLMEGCGSPG